MDLLPGYNAVRWTGPSEAILRLDWLAVIEKIYAHNPVTGAGFVGYTRGDAYPTLTDLFPGVDYLIDVDSVVSNVPGVTATPGAFEAFPGYVPTTSGPATPVTPTGPGFIATDVAAQNILGGMLVARIDEGLIPYSSVDLSLIHLLFGVALNSALPGGGVSVQRGGRVTYPGLNLPMAKTLFAGPNGSYAISNEGLAFTQIIGRAITPDQFIYQPEAIAVKYPFSLSIS